MASYKKKRKASEAQIAINCITKALNRSRTKFVVCGSLRREKRIIGDLDIIAEPPLETTVRSIRLQAQRKDKIEFEMVQGFYTLKNTLRKSITFLIDGWSVNLYMADEECWGAMKLFLTGSNEFNIWLRGCAKRRGMKLNRYGLWRGEERIAGKAESEIFSRLGVQFRIPKEREGHIKYGRL